MPTLTPAERRALRARAHALRPVVSIGQHGLTPSVLHEIDVSLNAHELIKIRVSNDDREAREAALLLICAELAAASVQHIGKLLVIWRQKPPAEVTPAKSAAKKAPQVRRPRTPLPRTPSRPMPSGPRSRNSESPTGRKHRGGTATFGAHGKSRADDPAAKPRSHKGPRSVTAAMWDDTDAQARRRTRTAPSAYAHRGTRAPAGSFASRGSGFGKASAETRPPGGPRPKRRVGEALPGSRSPATNGRRRRSSR